MHFSRTVAAAAAMLLLNAMAAAAQDTVFLATNSVNREVWRGQTAGSLAGFSLDRGDLNTGDSRFDLIVGAPGWDSSKGRVYVIFAGPVRRGEVSLGSANVILSGATAGQRFGEATAAGYITARELDVPLANRDLVVGAPGTASDAGAVYMFPRGLTNGQAFTTADAVLTITGAPAGARLGASLATGDLDGDGYREIIIGAPGAGNVYVVKGGAALAGTINLGTPSTAFFVIDGLPGDGVGRSLAAGDLTGHALSGTPNTIYDLAIAAHNQDGTGVVHILKGRTSNTFSASMALTELDLRFDGIDAGDRAGWAVEIASIDRDGYADLIVGAPLADGPANGRADGGEIYVVWGSSTLASRSLSTAEVTIYGAAAGHQEGTDLAWGRVSHSTSEDLVSLAPGATSASTAGELHVVFGRPRSGFGATYDFASTSPQRRFVGDPAAGPITTTLIYELTGTYEDVLAGVPGATEGLVYISFSPNYSDTREPNETSGTAPTISPSESVSSYVFTVNDVDWYKFNTRERAHVRVRLDVPGGVNYGIELYNSTGTTLLKTSDQAGLGVDEEIVTTLNPGTFAIRVFGTNTFSQSSPYTLLTSVGYSNDPFEPNDTTALGVTIGTLAYQAKTFSTEDVDWYRFRTAGAGTVNIQLTVPAGLDLQLDLYNSNGTSLIATSNNGAGINESIAHAATGATQFMLRVASSAGTSSTSANYTLAVTGANVANPTIPNILLGQGPYTGGGGWFALTGGVESSFGAHSWGQVPWASYNQSGGGIRVATGDVDADGADEVLVSLGTGGGGYVAVLDDAANGHALMTWLRVPWQAYINTYGGETYPAVGDLDGDGRAEIVLGLGAGGQGWYMMFDDAKANFGFLGWKQVTWAAYNAGASGLVRPAVADLDGDGVAEIVLGLGTGSGGWLQVVNNGVANYSHRVWIRVAWPTYNDANGATFPAAGDLDGDGKAELLVGLGSGSAGWYQIMDDAQTGFAHVKWQQVPWPLYNGHSGEVHPGVGNIDGDPSAEIVLGFAEYPSNGGWVQILDDAASGYSHLMWRRFPWDGFNNAGGAVFPAIATRR